MSGPRLTVRAVLVEAGRLLLVNAYPGEASDLWCAPGGGAERGLSLEENLRCEMLEETGLRVEGGSADCSGPWRRVARAWRMAGLAPRTRNDYARGFPNLRGGVGEVDAERLMNDKSLRSLVRAWIERNGWRGKEAADCLDAAKAFARRLVLKDETIWPQPLLGRVKKHYRNKPRAEFLWTGEQVRQLRRRSAPGTRPRFQPPARSWGPHRRAVWLGPEHAHPREKGGWPLIWTAGKTENSIGAVVHLSATPEVEEIIRTTPEGQKTFLLNPNGRPWKPPTLGKGDQARRGRARHHPVTLTADDRRGTAATEMAWKKGMTVKEPPLRFGWTEQTVKKMGIHCVTLTRWTVD